MHSLAPIKTQPTAHREHQNEPWLEAALYAAKATGEKNTFLFEASPSPSSSPLSIDPSPSFFHPLPVGAGMREEEVATIPSPSNIPPSLPPKFHVIARLKRYLHGSLILLPLTHLPGMRKIRKMVFRTGKRCGWDAETPFCPSTDLGAARTSTTHFPPTRPVLTQSRFYHLEILLTIFYKRHNDVTKQYGILTTLTYIQTFFEEIQTSFLKFKQIYFSVSIKLKIS